MWSSMPLSVITRIKPGEFDHLATVLDQIGNPDTNTLVDFHAITSLHFCCWVIVADDPRFSPCLVLESNYDGALEQHLDQLMAHAGTGLDAIYRTCEGYPAEGIASPQKVRDYLLANAVPTTAFYIGCPGQSVGEYPQCDRRSGGHSGISGYGGQKRRAGWAFGG